MKIIVKIKFGSHLYGTSTPNSDIDFKSVFMPSKKDVLLGRIPKSRNYSSENPSEKNTPADVDLEMYSLHYFVKLACDGQTVAMDMLHAPETLIMEKSWIWDFIVENRHRFYTKNLKSFIEYARRQASKYGIKGSRINAASAVFLLKRRKPYFLMRTRYGFFDSPADIRIYVFNL